MSGLLCLGMIIECLEAFRGDYTVFGGGYRVCASVYRLFRGFVGMFIECLDVYITALQSKSLRNECQVCCVII